MNRKWRAEEIQLLKDLIESNHTKVEIAEKLGRCVNGIQQKANRLGLIIYNTSDSEGNRGPRWRKVDNDLLTELWYDPTVSMIVMQDRLHRSKHSITKQALRLNLGPRQYDTEYLSIQCICEEMGVSRDRVARWFRLGLPRRKSRSGKTKYLVAYEDLVEFLKARPELFDAKHVSDFLFIEDSDWLERKRRKDQQIDLAETRIMLRTPFTDDEDKQIQRMFHQGLSDQEIADRLHRAVKSITRRRHVLNLLKTRRYSEFEKEYVRKWARYKTTQEIADILGRPSPTSIEWLCEKMKVHYHIKKERCEEYKEDNT